jgi:hypothetical protein
MAFGKIDLRFCASLLASNLPVQCDFAVTFSSAKYKLRIIVSKV